MNVYSSFVRMSIWPRYFLAVTRAELFDLNFIAFLNELGHEQNGVRQAPRARVSRLRQVTAGDRGAKRPLPEVQEGSAP